MKKLFTTLIVLLLVYFGLQFVFHLFHKGEDSAYEIEKKGITLKIDEQSHFRLTNQEDNYQYKIEAKNHIFHFQIFHSFNKMSRAIEDIAYYQNDNLECILPIFHDKTILSDMMCYDGDRFTYYYNLKGTNQELDQFANSIAGYKPLNYVPSDIVTKIEGIDVYKDNLIKNHYIEVTNYLGIYNVSADFNSSVYNISLYNKDIYNQKIGVFVDQYYLSADYNQSFEFHKFNVIDFVNLNTYTITSDQAISLDSYIQGTVDGKIYLYDKDHQKQYEINISKKTVTPIEGNEIKYYHNSEWTTMTLGEANSELLFDTDTSSSDSKYARIDKVGGEYGYYYLYLKTSTGYEVYRQDIHDGQSIIYLYSIEEIENIFYINDYVYFMNNNVVRVYHDSFGVKPLIKYNEMEFNKNLHFYIYAR